MARAMPVLPEVGSTRVVLPGVINPAGLCRLNHVNADAILHRGRGVHALQLNYQTSQAPFCSGNTIERAPGEYDQ